MDGNSLLSHARRALLHTAFMAAAVGVLPAVGLAQQPADRARLDAFWVSLLQTSDTAFVDQTRRALTRERKRDRNPITALEEGLAETRLSAMGYPRRSGDAERAFKRARDEEPEWPYPWYGHGLAKLAQARWQMDNSLNIGNRVGVGAMETAQAAFLEANRIDPTFEPALVELGRVALRLRTPERLDEALLALRHSAGLGTWSNRELYLLWAQLEYRVGDRDSALLAVDELERRGGPAGVVALERARVLLAAGDSAGIAAYFRGVGSTNAAAIAGYRRDIQPIAYEDELAAFDSAAAWERVALLRTFWQQRDDRDLRAPGTRIREHYRRLAFARRYFWLDVTRRHYWAEARFESEQLEFDDRGIVYLRHGSPSKRVTPFVYGSTANESWRYDRADGQWFFHFCAQGDLRDYRLIESAVDISFSRCNTGGVQMDQLLMSRYDLSPMYTRIATWGRNASARLARDERNLGRASIAEGTTSDTHELRYARELPVVVRPLVAGRRGDSSLVHIAFSVADLLPPDEIPTPLVTMVPVRLRFAAFDSSGAAVGRLDTTVVRRVDPDRAVTSERFALALPPGDWVYRMAVETVDSAGTLLERDTLRVHDFNGPLELSDLMIGRRGAAQWISSPIDTAYIDPAQQFTSRQPLELYYEVYGLPAGSSFQTRLEVRKKKTGLLSKVFGGTPAAISFTFEEQQRGDFVRARRTIDLDPLEPGVYILAIEIVDSTDRTVTRQTEITVAEEE